MNELAPGPSGRPTFVPYGLFSLWDILMKPIRLQDFVKLGEEIQEAKVCLDATQGIQIDAKARDVWFTVFGVLHDMHGICRRFGARQMRDILRERIPDDEALWELVKPKSWEEVDALVNAFKKELQDRVFLYMPAADAEYYQNNGLLSGPAKRAFPKLTQELRSAGNAYACGLPTACVFHCMRALEHALSGLAVDVGLKWEKEQWHNIIEMIEARIKHERNTLPSGLAKDERVQFLSEAAKEFMYFKDGWRNYVAHNRVNYEAPQALGVLEHVVTFTEILAPKLKE